MNKISVFLSLVLSMQMAFAQQQPVAGTNQNLPGGSSLDCNNPQGDEQVRACQNRLASGQGYGQQQQSVQASSNVQTCLAVLDKVAEQPQGGAAATGTAAPVGRSMSTTGQKVWGGIDQLVPTTTPVVVIDPSVVRKAKNCRAFQVTAAGTGAGSFGATSRNAAMDGRVYCIQRAGYTADYQSCMKALSMYNNVRMAESALLIVQGVQANNNQQQVQNETLQRTAAGDGQNAAYDAQISQASKASQLNQQKAMAYAAAVAALGSTLMSWIKDDPTAIAQTLCAGNRTQLGSEKLVATQPQGETDAFLKAEAVSAPAQCAESVKITYNSAQDEVIANKQAKAGFTAALMEFIAKGIQAGIAAKQLGDVAKQVEEAKKSTEDPYNPATFELCQVNAADPRCAGQVTTTTGSGLQDGGFSFGDNFGNNAFTPVGDAEDMGNAAQGPLAGSDRVADVNSPFADDAKKANGIIDPAAAATPGGAGAPQGGGGGGGAGAPGGGSASLGNDTPGMDDSKKESDIKANKADGKYNIAGGGAFQAIKPMKEENPFANLFGGKSGGGLDEERGPASGDIDGQDSGLFAKISKRYGQVQADKRIEAKNLDE